MKTIEIEVIKRWSPDFLFASERTEEGIHRTVACIDSLVKIGAMSERELNPYSRFILSITKMPFDPYNPDVNGVITKCTCKGLDSLCTGTRSIDDSRLHWALPESFKAGGEVEEFSLLASLGDKLMTLKDEFEDDPKVAMMVNVTLRPINE